MSLFGEIERMDRRTWPFVSGRQETVSRALLKTPDEIHPDLPGR